MNDTRNETGLYPSSKALRDLYRKIAEHIDLDDPAPWRNVSEQEIEMFVVGKPKEFVRRKKLQALTVSVLNRALLEGSLAVGYLKNDNFIELPAWIWANDIENTLFMGSLKVDALLPDVWWSLSGEELYVDTSAFRVWLNGINRKEMKPSPSLPEPNDIISKPAYLTSRALPNSSYVSLAETLGWLAFGISLEKDRLITALDSELLGPRSEGRLRKAVALLTDAGAGEKVAIVGKFVENYSDSESARTVNSERIEPVKLIDFGCFDSLHGGLVYGKGLSWETVNNSLEVIFSDRSDGFRDVMVHRKELLIAFPTAAAASKKSFPDSNRPNKKLPDAQLKSWWRNLSRSKQSRSQDALVQAVRNNFPNHFISRERIRELTGPRKRGKKPFSGKATAK